MKNNRSGRGHELDPLERLVVTHYMTSDSHATGYRTYEIQQTRDDRYDSSLDVTAAMSGMHTRSNCAECPTPSLIAAATTSAL